MKKLTALTLTFCLLLALTGCQKNTDSSGSGAVADQKGGSVYYLNFKPEVADVYQKIAKAYQKETGVELRVVTAASGTYEQTLKSEMAKSDAPTLFQINGPLGYLNWKDYCADLSDIELYRHLKDKSLAVTSGGKVYGIPYVVEGYGIIYNKTILNDYCTMDNAVISSVDEINNFATLKAVADDIQSRLDEINDKFGYDLQGAFTSAGMDGSSDWRFKTHLANLPIYYEYKDKGINSTDAIEGTYLDNYKQIWDLYITDSTCDPGMLSSKTGDEAESEFGMEEAVFYQNGTWEYNNIKDVGDDNLGILPIYIGVEGEEDQGICTGTENYWCVNSKASEDDIQATLDFMNWCVTSDEGTKAMGEDMGFVIPFKNAVESQNLFVQQDKELTAEGKTPVSWNFPTMPSEEWKNGVGQALTAYAADQTDDNWEAVRSAFVDGWKTEYELTSQE